MTYSISAEAVEVWVVYGAYFDIVFAAVTVPAVADDFVVYKLEIG